MLRAFEFVGRAILPFLLLILVWQAAVEIEFWPETFLPSPFTLPNTIWVMLADGSLANDLVVTVRRATFGGAIALILGLLFGILLSMSRRASDFLSDFTAFLQAIGEIGWLPVLVLWSGFGETTVIITVVYTVFFPVFFGTVAGFENIPQNLKDGVLTLGAKPRHVIFEVIIPGALPSIISGFRTGMGFGFRTVILAEMIVGAGGLGASLLRFREFFQIEQIIASMITIAVLWLVTDQILLRRLEAATVERWGAVR
jgi:NitT/TauT family transport system permease protein/taurine transport system permease protein